MRWDEHGGGCCGVSHIFDFPTLSVDKDEVEHLNDIISSLLKSLKDINRDENTDDPLWSGEFSHLFEIVLTDSQMDIWAKTLKEKGFKYVTRWLNDNSGNYCNLLVYLSDEEAAPYAW